LHREIWEFSFLAFYFGRMGKKKTERGEGWMGGGWDGWMIIPLLQTESEVLLLLLLLLHEWNKEMIDRFSYLNT